MFHWPVWELHYGGENCVAVNKVVDDVSSQVDGDILNLNGVNTLGENIADNGGIKATLR